jgi:hypothetical protein
VNRALVEMETDDRLPEAEKLGPEFGKALMDEVEALLVEER